MSALNRFVCCLLVWAAPVAAGGQVSSQVAGLESNPKYMSLLLKEKQLHHAEDSIMKVISDVRKLFSEDRKKYGAEILRLEDELFEVRNNIGIVVNEIGVIEQEAIASSLGGAPSVADTSEQGTAPAVAAHQVPNLIYNDYFREHLSQQDYAGLCRAQEMETLPSVLLDTYTANYRRMEALAGIYATAARDTAEAAYAELRTVGALNRMLADSLSRVWGYIYDNKVYAYSYLLDRLNRRDMLADFESQYRETTQLVASSRERVASEAVYGYPLYKKLVLSYEVALADLLGYTQARDSVSKALARMNEVSYDLPRIDPEERIFIVYGGIEVSSPSIYHAKNPIPEDEIHSRGTVYKVQLGVFSRKQPVSIFRGVSPLCYEKLEDGRYRYCAGAFREQSEAEAARDKLKGMGFRRPEVVVWRDGIFEQLDGADAAEDKQAPSQFYRVEIAGAGESVGAEIREILDQAAPGKELTRSTAEDGSYVYTVGSFDDRESADRLAGLLNAAAGISAKVLMLEN